MATQTAPLPQPPTAFGLDNLPYGTAFGSMGAWGDMYNATTLSCVEAAAIHAIMYWTYKAQGTMAPFQNIDGRNLYSLLAGFVPGNPATDHGTVDLQAFSYWSNTGITDNTSVNHKLVSAYTLPAGDVDALAQACYLCGVVYVGFYLTQQWQFALARSSIWEAVNPIFVGAGHTVPVIGRASNGNFIAVTWGGLVQLTPAGFRQLNYEAFALVSDDYINPGTGKSPLGYTRPQIEQYMGALAPLTVLPPIIHAPTITAAATILPPTVVP